MTTQGRKSFSRLYRRISTLFIVVLFVFAAITLYISVHAANNYSQEVNQNLNRNLAANVAVMMEPFMKDMILNEAGLEDLVHSLMVINPSIEVYLLNTEGKILSYVAPEKVVKLDQVSLDPVTSFLNESPNKIIYGDDPRNPGEKKIFSAAEVIQGDRLTGYIYIVLASQEYASAANLVRGSFIMGLSIRTIILLDHNVGPHEVRGGVHTVDIEVEVDKELGWDLREVHLSVVDLVAGKAQVVLSRIVMAQLRDLQVVKSVGDI